MIDLDLVKFDAEGSEFEFLTGTKNSLSLLGLTLLFECKVKEARASIEQLLKEVDYYVMVIFEDENGLDSVDCLEFYRGENGPLDRI